VGEGGGPSRLTLKRPDSNTKTCSCRSLGGRRGNTTYVSRGKKKQGPGGKGSSIGSLPKGKTIERLIERARRGSGRTGEEGMGRKP